jgi:hypothetical protein
MGKNTKVLVAFCRRHSSRFIFVATMVATVPLGLGCSSANFAGESSTKSPAGKPKAPTSGDAKKLPPPVDVEQPEAPQPILPEQCRREYQVPGTANIWLAGVSPGTRLVYRIQSSPTQVHTTIDAAPGQSPILVASAQDGCLIPGNALTFTVSGQISHGGSAISDANGIIGSPVHHNLGAALGKADLNAPINSLVGLFLTDEDPSGEAAPGTLDFANEDSRNQPHIEPLIGQPFFIGTAKTAAGVDRQVVIPEGATRLFFGIMDAYEWNNNTGSLSGAIQSTSSL